MSSPEEPEEAASDNADNAADDAAVADAPDPASDAEAVADGEDRRRTQKGYLPEADTSDFKLPPELSERIFAAMSPTMRLIAKQQTSSALKALHAAERGGTFRAAKLGQDLFAGLKVPQVHLQAFEATKSSLGISGRLRGQLATARIDAQLAPLRASIEKSTLPNVNFALRKLPNFAFSKMYGREWASIATKLANIQGLFDGINFDKMFAGWFPPNWDRDRGGDQYYRFIELAENEMLPLTWVPNQELTYLLADAEAAQERADLLVKYSSVIVADCRAVLDDFDNDSHLVDGLREALDAYEVGFHHPAQAYAASIVDTALREAFAPRRWSYPNVKKLLHPGKDWRSLAMRSARLLPTSAALRGLLEDFWTDRGDPIPTRPNRHASAHAVHPDQYNQVNAIKFLMLATAMLAEMEYDGWARILAAPTAAA